MLSHNNQSFRTKLSGNQTVFIFSNMLFWIDSHIFIYLDCLTLECFLVYVFSHIALFFNSINPRNKNRSIRCFHWSMMIVVSLTIWLSSWIASSYFSLQNSLMNVSVTLFIIICFEIYMLHFKLLFILLLFPFKNC